MLPTYPDFRRTLPSSETSLSVGELDAALGAARAEVMHRLALALLREGFLRMREGERSGNSVRYVVEMGEAKLSFEFSGAGDFMRFNRLERCDLDDGRALRPIRCPLELLDHVLPHTLEPVAPAAAAQLKGEIDNCVANLTLGIAAHRGKRAELFRSGRATLEEWIAQFGNDNDRLRRALERQVYTGHRLHVCAKTRRGMTPAEVMRYSPELNEASIPVRWVALHRRAALLSGASSAELLDELWPAATREARAALSRRGHAPEHYALLPVHPWQMDHAVAQRVLPKLGEHDLVVLDATAMAYPQLSLRTVEPVAEDPDRAPRFHCKLPLGVQTTSAERTVSPQSVHNGPLISQTLKDISQIEALPLTVVEEVAGICLDPSYRDVGNDVARQLGLLVRQNPSYTARGETQNWLCSALCSRPTFGHDHLVTQWLRRGFRYGSRHELLHDWVQRFWRRYCEALIKPTAALLGKYGIALEAHSQNTLLDFDDEGLPTRLRIRDFGGVRIHRATLAEAGKTLELFADSATDAPDWHGTVTKFFHTVFQMHLTDVLQALQADGHTVLSPWRVAFDCFSSAYRERGIASALHRDLPILCAPHMDAKCLMKMRLLGDYRDYTYAPVPNPLHAFA